MRISDWSSDVCSSDLSRAPRPCEPSPPNQPGRPGLCTGCRSGRGELTPGQSAPVPCAAMAVLGDYETERFTWAGKTRDVYRRGSGPAVIVIAEMPGITPSVVAFADRVVELRSEEHTSELQSLMRISYDVFCLTKTKKTKTHAPRQKMTISIQH